MKYGAYLTGAFGQSQALDLARRKGGEALERQILADTKQIIELQQSAGLSYVVDPMFRFFSIYDPLLKGVKGFSEGSQNPQSKNLFYIWPKIAGPLNYADVGFTEKLIHLDLLPQGKAAVILPSPYMVLMDSEIKGYQNQKSAIIDIAQLFREEAKRLVEKGIVRIQYDERVFPAKQSRGSMKQVDFVLLQIAMDQCGKIEGATTSLHTYFGNVSCLIPFLRELPVDCIGIDGTVTSIGDLLKHNLDKKELALGLLDISSNSKEEPKNLATKLRKVMETTRPSALYLTPNTSTERIGWTLGTKKLMILQETIQEVRENE